MTGTALSEYDALVAQMTSIGIPLEKAESAARRQLHIQPRSAMEALRDDALVAELEDNVVEEGDRIMQALGFTVVRFSQKRKSKVTEGIPDRRYYHRRRRLVLWWEAKSSSGKQRPEQREFQILCDDCGDPYVLGGLEPLRAWLTEHRVAEFDEQLQPHPIPFDNA